MKAKACSVPVLSSSLVISCVSDISCVSEFSCSAAPTPHRSAAREDTLIPATQHRCPSSLSLAPTEGSAGAPDEGLLQREVADPILRELEALRRRAQHTSAPFNRHILPILARYVLRDKYGPAAERFADNFATPVELLRPESDEVRAEQHDVVSSTARSALSERMVCVASAGRSADHLEDTQLPRHAQGRESSTARALFLEMCEVQDDSTMCADNYDGSVDASKRELPMCDESPERMNSSGAVLHAPSTPREAQVHGMEAHAERIAAIRLRSIQKPFEREIEKWHCSTPPRQPAHAVPKMGHEEEHNQSIEEHDVLSEHRSFSGILTNQGPTVFSGTVSDPHLASIPQDTNVDFGFQEIQSGFVSRLLSYTNEAKHLEEYFNTSAAPEYAGDATETHDSPHVTPRTPGLTPDSL